MCLLDEINKYAPLLSAIGTVFAAVVALYLARRQNKASLKIFNEDDPNSIEIRIVNTGFPQVYFHNSYWTFGFIRKRKKTISYTTPKGIIQGNGDTAYSRVSYHDLAAALSDFLEEIKHKHFQNFWLFSIKIVFIVSNGQKFSVRVNKKSRKKIFETYLQDFEQVNKLY